MHTAITGTRLAAPHALSEFAARLLTVPRLVVMSCSPLLVAVFGVLVFISGAYGEAPKKVRKTHTIPLDQIWAYDMPGTRDIQELGKGEKRESGRALIDLISVALLERAMDMRWKDVTRSEFALGATDLAALKATHNIFVQGAELSNDFSTDERITLVFFSEPIAGEHLHLRKAERIENRIDIQYRLEPYTERHVTFGLALIPLGLLPAGQYQVNIHQLSREKKFIESGSRPLNENWARMVLCKPFSFNVAEKAE